MTDHARLPVDAVLVQRVVPRLLWLRWPICAALTPTLVFPFLWAWLVWRVLCAFAWLGDPHRALRVGRSGVIEVEGGVLRIEQGGVTTAIPCEDLREGWTVPGPNETFVLLRLRDGRRIVASTEDFPAARRLLRAAGVSADRRVLEVPLGSLARAEGQGPVLHLLGPVLAGLCILFSLLMLAEHNGLSGPERFFACFFLVGGLAIIPGLLHWATPGRAIVGADGVRVVRLFGTTFVPYEQIRAVKTSYRGVVLETDRGLVRLWTRSFVDDSPQTCAALAARLEEAIQTFRAERLEDMTSRFAREGRPVAAWREDLRRLAEGGDYRRVAMESEDILRVAEDAASPAERRVGAALALSDRKLPPALRARLGAVSASSANPRLRIALDKAAAGELGDEDLAGLEAEPARVVRRAVASR